MSTRRAERRDQRALIAFDPVAGEDPERLAFLERALDSSVVLVTTEGDEVIAYGVLHESGFFSHDFVELLVVAASHRRRGLGSALLTALADHTGAAKVFTSTNTSNAPMRALLARDGWLECGHIDHLDPGDPELVFVRLTGT